MDLPGAAYLDMLAQVAVTFVGFSALVVVLRQTFGGEMSRLDILITRIFIQLGFIVVGGAMLPPLLFLFPIPQDWIWRVSSLAAAIPAVVFGVTYPARRFEASNSPTPLIIWIDIGVLLLSALVLFCNALGIGFAPGPGPHCAGLTGILFLSGWAYLQALKLLLAPHMKRLPKAGQIYGEDMGAMSAQWRSWLWTKKN